jgi:branched-chain amino acid transport system permease protein
MATTTAVGTPSRRRRTSSIAWPIGFALLIPLVFVFYKFWLPNLTVESFFDNWLSMSAINESLVWVIMALGLNIVVGYAGLLDLGYVAFWAIGGYTAGWLMSTFFTQVKVHVLAPTALNQAVGIHITFWFVIFIAAAFCALWGIIIGAPTLRLRSDYLALVTLGFGEIIPQVFLNGESIGGFNLSNGSKGINPIDPIGTGPLGNVKGIPTALGAFDLPFKFLIYAALAALCVFVSLRLREGRLGRAWLAIREDELAASMMGVPLVKAKLSSYAVGAFFGGIGGVVYATQVNGVFPNFSFSNSITILLMVVLGGMGNVWGVIIGALVLSWINNTGLAQFGQLFNNQFHTNINFPSYNYLIFGVILVLMMLFRREGLLPEARTRQILREPARVEMESVGADIDEGEAEIEATTPAEVLVGPTADDNPDQRP